jgi:hypothetical protein
MRTLEASTPYHAYHVPRADRSALIDPPLDSAAALLAGNRRQSAAWELECSGLPIDQLRQQAREELLRAALHYTTRYREYSGPTDSSAILLAGHQPQLFHPGVWFKNFALSHLGQQLGATPINLVVDNDLRGSGSVRVPSQSPGGAVQASSVAYDDPGPSVPLEQHRIGNRRLFDSFDRRLAAIVAPWVQDPCVLELWRHARAAADRCENTGCALAGARHALEGELGLQTLELPLSVVCRTRSFAAFLIGLIGELPRLHDCYNESVKQYRAAHGIRSHAHPVPLLGEQDDWLEAPLWLYGDARPQRRPVWVRMAAGRLEISDGERICLSIDGDLDRPQAAEQLFEQQSAEIKLRPRALITTMFSRLVLGDVFLHGIGGGKYDQLGDTIMRRFFGIEPPRFMVLSATVQMPGVDGEDASQAEQQLREEIRDTHFNPQRFAGRAALPVDLLEQHRQLIAEVPARGEKRSWHQELQWVRERLAADLGPLREQLQAELAAAATTAKQQQLLSSREHPFCIYPLEQLTSTFAELLK